MKGVIVICSGLFLFLLGVLFIVKNGDKTSNNTEPKKSINFKIVNGESYPYELRVKYIKGKKTHLCFARIGDDNEIDHTSGIVACVPCDSLKNVNVEEIDGM